MRGCLLWVRLLRALLYVRASRVAEMAQWEAGGWGNLGHTVVEEVVGALKQTALVA